MRIVSVDVDTRVSDAGAVSGVAGVRGCLWWAARLSPRDRRMLAEEIAGLMAEAAETGDLAPVEQALREWRATAEVHADPVLARRLSEPVVANGRRVPRPGS